MVSQHATYVTHNVRRRCLHGKSWSWHLTRAPQLQSLCIHSFMQLPCTVRIQRGFQVQLLLHKLKATSSSCTARNVSFRFAGAKPSGKAMFPRWPDRVLVYLDQTVWLPIQLVWKRCPCGLGFAFMSILSCVKWVNVMRKRKENSDFLSCRDIKMQKKCLLLY